MIELFFVLPIYIILFILITNLSIALHELGHIIACKLTGIKISLMCLNLIFFKTVITSTKFLFKFKWPLLNNSVGGYVKIPSNEEYYSLSLFIISLAGPIINLILAVGSIIFMFLTSYDIVPAMFAFINVMCCFMSDGDLQKAKEYWKEGFYEKY